MLSVMAPLTLYTLLNRCIVQLSSTTGSLEPAGLWGGGRELILELCDGALRLVDQENGQVDSDCEQVTI
jgi:hypothetical protein